MIAERFKLVKFVYAGDLAEETIDRVMNYRTHHTQFAQDYIVIEELHYDKVYYIGVYQYDKDDEPYLYIREGGIDNLKRDYIFANLTNWLDKAEYTKAILNNHEVAQFIRRQELMDMKRNY